jgi:hypothetical protein
MMRKLLVLVIFVASNGEAQEPVKEAVPPAIDPDSCRHARGFDAHKPYAR